MIVPLECSHVAGNELIIMRDYEDEERSSVENGVHSFWLEVEMEKNWNQG